MPAARLATLRRMARNPRMVVRVVLGTLLAANLVAALFVVKPWTGSAAELERQAASLRQSLRQQQTAINRLRGLVGKVQAAQGDGDKFMDTYLLGRRTLASALVLELDQTAQQAGIKQRDISYGFEPIEGSDSLSKAIITASYEGTYADLLHFLNLLDHSPRLLVIDSLAAAPQQNGMTLSVTMKLNAFIREGAPARVEVASAQGAGK